MTDSEKLDLILSKVGNLETTVGNLETTVGNLETTVENLEATVGNLGTTVGNLEVKVENFETNLQEVKKRVINTDLLIENEIRVNIQRVAEGHLDISRNLHDALKIDNEKEMLAIRVNVLESEIRRIKTHLDIA